MTKTEVITLLNFMPHLEALSAIAWNMELEMYEEPTNPLKLDSLKRIKLSSFDTTTVEFFTLFLRKNLIVDMSIQGDAEEFLANQQSIEKLDLQVESLSSEAFNNMKLSELKLKLRRYKDSENNSIIRSITEAQPELKTLNIVNCEGCFDEDSGAFEAICCLRHLESLKINIDDLDYSVFERNFNKLKNLKSLEIESVNRNYAPIVAIIEKLCQQVMLKLEHLKIYLIDVGVPLNRIENMGKNFKNLKSFEIRCDHPLPLDRYLSNFNDLKAFSIDYHYSKEFSKIFSNLDFKSNSLRELSCLGFGFGSDDFNSNEMTLVKMADVVPNLEKLDLDVAFPFSIDFLLRVIAKFRQIKVIKGWSLVQSGDNYKKFDYQSVENLLKIADMLHEFSVEIRLKAIDMDSSIVTEYLRKGFKVEMTRVCNFIAIRLKKNK